MSELYQSLAHSRWNCKYHVVFVPKHRRKKLVGEIRCQLSPIFHELARQKECRMIEGHVMPDHIHMCIEVPPKYAVASVIGLIKGKSAIAIARQLGGVIATTRASISGLVVMRSQQLALSWNKSRPTSGTKTAMMMMAGSRSSN